jgi:hypothetical protein
MTDILASRATRSRETRPLAEVGTPAPAPPRIVWERVDTERYCVLIDGVARGYVDVVGSVFVALAGARYDRAEEVAQSLAFDRAILSVVRSSARAAVTP